MSTTTHIRIPVPIYFLCMLHFVNYIYILFIVQQNDNFLPDDKHIIIRNTDYYQEIIIIDFIPAIEALISLIMANYEMEGNQRRITLTGLLSYAQFFRLNRVQMRITPLVFQIYLCYFRNLIRLNLELLCNRCILLVIQSNTIAFSLHSYIYRHLIMST